MKINYFRVSFAVVTTMLLTSVLVHASQTDERIESAAQNSYVYKTYLKEDSIKTVSKDGVVTLTGTVKEASHQSLAQDTVANLPGVIRVDNQLVLNGEQPAENSDGWLSMKVKGILLFNRNVSAVKTQVYVNEGIVTLKGEAETQAQKDLTTEYVKDVGGIKEVKNEMTIATVESKSKEPMGDKIDDASITAQVKMAFLLHHSISAIKTGVTTNDGVVTLSGKVNNGAVKDLAAKVASNVNGVNHVVNNITIGE